MQIIGLRYVTARSTTAMVKISTEQGGGVGQHQCLQSLSTQEVPNCVICSSLPPSICTHRPASEYGLDHGKKD